MEDRIILLMVVGIASISMGFALSGPFIGDMVDSGEDLEHDYFVTQGVLHGNVYEFGFNEDPEMNSPMRVRPLSSPSRVRLNFVNTNASMADIWFFEADRVMHTQQNTRILPYQVNVNEEFLGVYVSEDSEIQSPEDLDGKTVKMPQVIANLSETSLMVLKDRYDVEMERVGTHKGVSDARAPVRVLESGEADAVVVSGTKRLNSNHSMRPVYYPYRDMEEEFGDAALPTFFFAKNSLSDREANKMIKALQNSSRYAQNNSDRFMEIFEICNEFMVEDGSQIERMSPGSEDQLQYLMDLSRNHSRELTTYDVDISKHIHR
jgi:hypothetical protein